MIIIDLYSAIVESPWMPSLMTSYCSLSLWR